MRKARQERETEMEIRASEDKTRKKGCLNGWQRKERVTDSRHIRLHSL